jgi:aspartate/methionine/tyrosine aminotransferase
MTGWRLGAAIGPKPIIDVINKLNVNDESCSNHMTQYAALEALTGDRSGPAQILGILQSRRDLAADILNKTDGVRCIRPKATFYLFPNITAAMSRKNITDYNEFRKTLLRETGVSVCTRLHFGRPLKGEKEFYIRLAYSGIDYTKIEEGLAKFKAFMEK